MYGYTQVPAPARRLPAHPTTFVALRDIDSRDVLWRIGTMSLVFWLIDWWENLAPLISIGTEG